MTHAAKPLSLLPLVALIFYDVSGGPFGIEASCWAARGRLLRAAAVLPACKLSPTQRTPPSPATLPQDAVSKGAPLLAIIGFLVLPFIWSMPEALVTAGAWRVEKDGATQPGSSRAGSARVRRASAPPLPPAHAAELATTFPENSGYVAWVTAAFGPFWGFQASLWAGSCRREARGCLAAPAALPRRPAHARRPPPSALPRVPPHKSRRASTRG